MAHVVIQVRFYEAVYTSASRSTAKTASPFSYQAYLVKRPKPPSCFRPKTNTESRNVFWPIPKMTKTRKFKL